MRDLAEYIISVSAAALVCGILNSMIPKGTAKEVLKLVSGLFLVFCVISPVSNLRLPELADIGETIREEAATAVEDGEEMATESVRDSISQQLEAYILDKASSMGLDIEVEVFLKQDDSFLPESVTIRGSAAQQQKKELLEELTDALGITQEDITWTRES